MTFPPNWLIDACLARGWTYATASYRLMPESPGLDVLADAVDAVKWVHENISHRIIIAGSSAGGYLALAAAAHHETPKPVAVLSIYGLLDPSGRRYIERGLPLRAPIPDLQATLQDLDTATRTGKVIDGYPFPLSPPTDQRFKWICALHEDAKYPDQLTRIPDLAKEIASQGVSIIPEKYRVLFPVSFGLNKNFPPTILLHGKEDILVQYDQSTSVAEKMRSQGIDTHLELVEAEGHGFDTKETNVESMDLENGDTPVRGSLRRVIVALENAVAMNTVASS